MEHLEPFALHRAGRVRQSILGRSEHECERCAELVTDIREERRLRPIQFGEGLGPLALFRVGVRIRDRRGRLSGHKLQETSV